MKAVLEQLRGHVRASRRRDVGTESVSNTEPDTESILRALYKGDRRREDSRIGDDLLHVSGLCQSIKCARQLYLAQSMREEGVSFAEAPFGNMRLVWAFGRAAERHVRDTLLLDPAIREAAYGAWACKCGQTRSRGHYPIKPQRCTGCGDLATYYRELAFHDDDRSLVGNPDIILKQGTRYTVVEIKSIKKEGTAQHVGFNTIEAPIPKHVEQGTHYRHLGQRNGLAMSRKPIILYVLKDFDPRKWYKALVPSNQLQAQVDADVEAGRSVAMAYHQARVSSQLPGKIPECVENMDRHKKACPVWAECRGHG